MEENDPKAELPAGTALRQELERQFEECGLMRPFARACYDPGERLSYEITCVLPATRTEMVVEIERAVGGGFAGQVYRVRLLSLGGTKESVAGLEVGRHYAIKILTPPSGFSRVFRNTLFALAYQGHFAAQVNPASVRVGVLWQKLIRRAAEERFGSERAVCDTFATFYDNELHSFGEINEWIEGRIWKFEVDNRLFERWDFANEPPVDHPSREYVHKKLFMGRLVDLLHDMGAAELARQYEWWTLKSQPNALKRIAADTDPASGLTAVDFRAGLALLPFLPMSPMDVPLIVRGLLRGRIVQFDRTNVKRFDSFVDAHEEALAELQPAIEELRKQETIHRGSMLDLTHHHLRVLFDRDLRRSVKEGTITAWRHLGWIDDNHAERLSGSAGLFIWFRLLTLIPLVGARLLQLWGNPLVRAHAWHAITSFDYLWRAMRGNRVEALVRWHRVGRVSPERARTLVRRPVRFWTHRIGFSWLPVGLHRSLTEWGYAWQRLRAALTFTMRFLREPSFREDWLMDQVRLGRKEGMLSAAEAEKVARDIKDPYIQKYLRCLAVHVCTVPVTQIVMVVVGAAVAFYMYGTKGLSWVESAAAGSAAGALIQLSPISPGSIARGLFVLFLMIRERDIKNYYVAAPVAFIHVIGYLAFPLQMVIHNPGLARFMAGRWATSLVGIVPVFGERGGLLEHAVFDTFFNLPLSVKRSFKLRPLAWSAATAVLILLVVGSGFLAYTRIWEWRQPSVEVQALTLESVTPYFRSGGDIHWTRRGQRVYLGGGEQAPSGAVDFPAAHWDASLAAGDRVDVVVRKSYFGDQWDGIEISRADVGEE